MVSGYSQTMDDIKKEADGLFKKEQFIEATPLYLQLLNVEPRNHELNYKYGTCLLFSSQDKSEAIKFLNFSVKNPSIDKNAYYYLGKAYHLNFEFSKAITYYRKFESVSSGAEQKAFNIAANVSACNHGRQLLTNITDMIVIEKKEVRKEDFYELYTLNDIGGSLIRTDRFQSKYDKKVDHRPIIYFPDNSPYIFYSSYGEDGKTGLDIYVKQKLPNGKWSNAIKVVGDVNTAEDEDFPYLSPDGKYLYYSSKGHNSMGGYDVFRSKVIIEGSSFSSPENMDFAISSPDDDILYIVDSLDRTAYFSSARESQAGNLNVYKVRVEKIPMQISVIKGSFTNEIDPGNREVEIIVINAITGEEVGIYNSKPGSGDVLLTIPKSGKYKFELTVEGSEFTHLAEVSIPHTKEFRPLKMNITNQYADNGEELIVVTPLFDERFDDPSEVMADVFQEMSKLSPNSSGYDLDSLNELRGTDDVFIEAGIDVYSTPEDVEEIISSSIEETKTINEANELNSLIAHNLATQKQEEAKSKISQAKTLIEEAEAESDIAIKSEKLREAYKLTQQAIELNTQASQLVQVGERIEENIKDNEAKLIALNNALVDIKSVEQDDRERLTSFVGEHSELLLDAQSKSNTNVLDDLQSAGNQQKQELNDITSRISDLTKRQNELKSREISLNEKLINTKKNKDKIPIQEEIESVQGELEAIESEILTSEGKLDRLNANDITSIDLADASAAINDKDNRTDANTTPISNTQKLKVKFLVEDQTFLDDVSAANQVFEENNISGEYADLSGLNESMVKARNFSTPEEFDDEIERLQNQYDASTDDDEKERIQNVINQLSDLKDETLDGSSVANVAMGDTKDELVTNYQDRLEAIQQINDVEKRKEQEATLNEALGEEVKKAIKAKEKELKEDPENDQLISELNTLKTIETDVNNDLEAYNDWKETKNTDKGKSDFTYEDALLSANPEYQDRVNEIYNSDKSDDERAEELRVLNASTLANAEERLQEVNSVLSQNEGDADALNEKKHLSKLVDELENNSNLPLIEPEIKTNLENVVAEVDPNQLVNDYEDKLSKIDKSAINDLDKEKAKIQINNELVKKINSEIITLNNEIENKADNSKTYKKRVENLEKLKFEVEDEIKSSQAIIDEIAEENPSLANSVESIFPNYTNRSYEINELGTDSEKRAAIKTLNEEALAAIEKKKKELKIAYAANPREELKFSLSELEKLSLAIERKY